MQAVKFVVAMGLGLLATLTQAAGLRLIDVPADASGPALKAAVWTPCAAPQGEIVLGSYTLPGVRDCPIQGDHLGLIVVSHGYGGNYLGHHDTAEALADGGFVVVALNHPDDTTANKDRAANAAALISRPTDVKRLIDFMLGGWPDAARIDQQRIGFFGFSRGGYTGLVIAGATPNRWRVQAPAWVHDARVKAVVIADPLSIFPTQDSLKDVKVPLQLWASERGGDGVQPEDVAAVARNLPVRPEFRVVPGTAHFAFLAPCAPWLTKAVPQICIDDGGFDRAAFHEKFDAEVLAYFRAHLAPSPKL